jgi:hypothetical protein
MSRTALREDPRNSNGNSDSPSGGPSNSPSGKRSKLRPLYGVAHIRCQLSGRASPSRTSSCRNPDSLSALRNSFRGREREARQVYGMCMRARMGLGLPYALLYIGKPRGRNVTQKTPKCPWHIPFQKGICHMGVPCGAPWWSSTLGRPPLGGDPPMRCHALLPLLEGLFGISKKVLFQKYQNLLSLFTTTFFSVRMN